ncbi:MAG: ABC transporter substrate-binding protein, partial [Alphaproteobacteria bacterium]
MGILRTATLALCLIGLIALAAAADVETVKSHGLSLAGPLKYGPDFKHLDYVNPDAPKGGDLRLATIGGFDNLNPYIPKGQSATGLSLTFETLMTESSDDPSAEYGLVAQSVEVAKDLSFAIYNLRPEAKFNDGSPITADDIIYSLSAVKTKGSPLFRYYYAN